MSISTALPLSSIDSGLQITKYNTELNFEAIDDDIFDRMGGDAIFSGEETPPIIPDAIYVNVSADGNSARTIRFPMIKEFTQAPGLGSGYDPRGNEEDRSLKHFDIQYTDACHASPMQKYGVEAISREMYGIDKDAVRAEGLYWKQYKGKCKRQALLEQMSENLHEAPHFLDDGWSPNWYIPNVADGNQPTFDIDHLDHTSNIVDALVEAGHNIYSAGTVHFLGRLEDWAKNTKRIKPLAEGKYILTLPTPTARWYKNPVSGLGTLGELFTRVAGITDQRLHYSNVLGMVGDIILVEDPRYPTLTTAGSASGSHQAGAHHSLTAQYEGMGLADDGSSDPRDKTANAWLVGFLLGKGAIFECNPEPLHWEYEWMMYDKYAGQGVFTSFGIKQPIYNLNTGTSAGAQQFSSVVVPFSQPPWQGY